MPLRKESSDAYRGIRFMSERIRSQEDFDRLTSMKDKTVLIDFYADWCGPCKMISPVIESIEAERDDVVVGKLNVDENIAIAQAFRVVSIPTVLIYKNGENTGRIVGFQTKED